MAFHLDPVHTSVQKTLVGVILHNGTCETLGSTHYTLLCRHMMGGFSSLETDVLFHLNSQGISVLHKFNSFSKPMLFAVGDSKTNINIHCCGIDFVMSRAVSVTIRLLYQRPATTESIQLNCVLACCVFSANS